MSEGTGRKTKRMLKLVIGITMSASVILSNLLCVYAQPGYPYSSKYPSGIEDADVSFFTEKEVNYPLNIDFESNEDIEFVKSNSQNGQISLSEDAYGGKFALDIKAKSNEKMLIKSTEYFTVGKNMIPMLYTGINAESEDEINVLIIDKEITITGLETPGKEITLILYDKDGQIAYIDLVSADAEGIFTFNFVLESYGTYSLHIGNLSSGVLEREITVTEDTITDVNMQIPELVETKTNLVKLWIKPKYKAESISFYITAPVDGVEKQIAVLGDKDSDGVFKVSEDLAMGRWQAITLDLLKLAETPDTVTVKDFYISVNPDSQWVMDSFTSDYREISSSFVNLETFAKENIICNENGELTFSTDESGNYENLSRVITSGVDINEMISGITVDSEIRKNTTSGSGEYTNDKVTVYPLPTVTEAIFSGDYKKLFFRNEYDNNNIYCLDTTTLLSNKVLDASYVIQSASYTGDRIMTTNGTYDITTGEYIPKLENATKHYLSPSGDVFAVRQIDGDKDYHEVYKYSEGIYHLFYKRQLGSQKRIYNMAFSNNGEFFAVYDGYYWKMYKNTSNGVEYIAETSRVTDGYLTNEFISNDGTRLFFYDSEDDEYVIYDSVMGITTYPTIRYIRQSSDGRYLINDKGIYYLFDDVTGNREAIYHDNFGNNYCSERNWFLEVEKHELRIVDHNMNTDHNKYLVSFDGKKTWYTYDGGKWIPSSYSTEPDIEEMRKSGMTKEKINSIPEEAYKKFYGNGSEVYTLNFAIGMFGSLKNITPVVRSISVETLANQPVDHIYSAKLFTFDKSDYNKINAVFPVESFPKVSECYYLLYLGNDWLYTYKDGKAIRVDITAEDVARNTEENWLSVKQSGLTANEVRSIPSSVLTELFLNSEFANTKFGVVAIAGIKDDTTETYDVDIKLSADTEYISGNGYYLEISLNGAEKIVYTPEQITKTQIDEFLSWIDQRQNGNGAVFYRIETEYGQKFINYFNIANVNVYRDSLK